MSSRSDQNDAFAVYLLLAACAQPIAHTAQRQKVRQLAHRQHRWDTLIEQGERHGLGPLLYQRSRTGDVDWPAPIKRALRGLYARHRQANRVRATALAEILRTLQGAGLEVLILKGAALAHLIYPEPGLRPMRDIDLLVRPEAARQAQSILLDLEYKATVPAPQAALPAKHLAVAQRQSEGMTVSVEIHHNLYADGTAATSLDALWPAAVSFSIDDVTAYTLSYEALLSHLYQHLRIASLHDHLRLIWVADLVGVAARFAAEIDWAYIKRNQPQLLWALAACHWLTPLPDQVRNLASESPEARPRGVGIDFQGWPQTSLAAQRGKGWGRILADTFFPSPWWLSFYYGLAPGPALWWGRWIQHPLHILGWVWHDLKSRNKS